MNHTHDTFGSKGTDSISEHDHKVKEEQSKKEEKPAPGEDEEGKKVIKRKATKKKVNEMDFLTRGTGKIPLRPF